MESRSIFQSPAADHSRTNHPHTTPTFPLEIIAEILARLPIRSLLRFRCVSKSWRSLISSDHFIKSHLTLSKKDANFSRHRVISTLMLPTYTLEICSLISLSCADAITDAVDLDYPMKSAINSVRIVGCCDGLVCLAINGKHFFLWNPSTRKHKKLPDADGRMKRGLFITKYGFGFDESGQDYKVVGVLSGFCAAGRYETVVKIYSLKTHTWKRIEAFKEGLPFDDVGKFVSGKLHWGSRIGFNSRWDIVSLDLGSGVSGTVAQPGYIEGSFSPALGVLRECLCVLCDFPKTSANVWIMREYGVRESWEKVATVPYISDPWKGPYSTPLWIGSKGEILMVYGSRFVVYDARDSQFRYPKIMNFGTFLEADIHLESLASLEPACA